MDDEESIRELVAAMLSTVGYEVATAADGAEAIELYSNAKESGRPFDAIIMDLTIPGGMGGRDAIQRLTDVDPGVKVIVSSGYSRDPVMANFREHGFKGVIAKPYKAEELNAVLYEVMSDGQS